MCFVINNLQAKVNYLVLRNLCIGVGDMPQSKVNTLGQMPQKVPKVLGGGAYPPVRKICVAGSACWPRHAANTAFYFARTQNFFLSIGLIAASLPPQKSAFGFDFLTISLDKPPRSCYTDTMTPKDPNLKESPDCKCAFCIKARKAREEAAAKPDSGLVAAFENFVKNTNGRIEDLERQRDELLEGEQKAKIETLEDLIQVIEVWESGAFETAAGFNEHSDQRLYWNGKRFAFQDIGRELQKRVTNLLPVVK
jgi:hypothetical protein